MLAQWLKASCCGAKPTATAALGPGCVKTCASQACPELFSQLPFFRQKLPVQLVSCVYRKLYPC